MALLSVVIPAYNEEEMLPKAVEVIGAILEKDKIDYECHHSHTFIQQIFIKSFHCKSAEKKDRRF